MGDFLFELMHHDNHEGKQDIEVCAVEGDTQGGDVWDSIKLHSQW